MRSVCALWTLTLGGSQSPQPALSPPCVCLLHLRFPPVIVRVFRTVRVQPCSVPPHLSARRRDTVQSDTCSGSGQNVRPSKQDVWQGDVGTCLGGAEG